MQCSKIALQGPVKTLRESLDFISSPLLSSHLHFCGYVGLPVSHHAEPCQVPAWSTLQSHSLLPAFLQSPLGEQPYPKWSILTPSSVFFRTLTFICSLSASLVQYCTLSAIYKDRISLILLLCCVIIK